MKEKKVVIITGAAGGIGMATAKKFAAHDYHLVLADINLKGLIRLKELLTEEYQAECLICHGSLEDLNYVKGITQQAADKWHRIDVLVNNAAYRTIETMRTISVEQWEKTLRVNLTAPAFLAKYVAGFMEKEKIKGVIINTSSMMSQRVAGTSPAYITCKGAIESLTYEMAVLYGPRGIRVIGINPGNIDTHLSADYKDDKGTNISQKLMDDLSVHTPLQRAGYPEEIASASYWLSTEGASFITGTILQVDGGFQHNLNSYQLKNLQFPKEF